MFVFHAFEQTLRKKANGVQVQPSKLGVRNTVVFAHAVERTGADVKQAQYGGAV